MWATCKSILEYEIAEAEGKVDLDFIIRFGRIMDCGLNSLKCSDAEACGKFLREKYELYQESQLSQK